ncbi:MAG: hypothetical protein ACON5N_11120 [Akkermansiaceae bacterium]
MSLHASLSSEARHRLFSQRRRSTLTSIIIALLVMLLVGVILLIINLATPKEAPSIVTYRGEPLEEKPINPDKVNVSIKRKPTPPSKSSAARQIVADVSSPVAVPIPPVETLNAVTAIGSDGNFGEGFYGNDNGQGIFNNIPTTFRKRCSQADRLQRLQESGGTPECEEAVVKALRWLKETQNNDGSWTNQYQVGMTGLALLAYLGHCETAQSEEFGETVLAAMTYLVDKAMSNNGRMAADFKNNHWCYEHAIATYALAEAFTLTRAFGEHIAGLEDAVLSSGQFLINSQHESGGWDYGYAEDSSRGGDLSIVGWHLQALKACMLTGLEFKNLNRAAKEGLKYVESCQLASGAMGYTGPNLGGGRDGTSLAAVGALVNQMWKGNTRVATKACRFIDKTMKFDWHTGDSDLYGHYYAAQAMMNFGGEAWDRYNERLLQQVLPNQAEDGSFLPVAKGGAVNAPVATFAEDNPFATHYRTCLATLMLEVYYRYLPTISAK